ncbi:MAG: VWA domain-containing protein [Planctomycetes bacterium]|nr:VWA domain-containing protein [Planctomycetota bacterium]
MKKKILTVSILLGITAIAIVGYFVGCSQHESGTVSSRTADRSSEEEGVTFADVSDKPDSKAQLPTEPQAILSQPQKDVAEDGIRLRKQLSELIKADDKERADILTKTDESGIPHVTFQNGHAIDSFKGKSQREMGEFLESKSEKSAKRYFVNGQVLVLGDKKDMDEISGYGRTGVRGIRGSDRSGGMGGKRYRTKGPAPTLRNESLGITTMAGSRPSGSGRGALLRNRGISRRPDKQRIPVELLNVTEDEIWVIARPETQAVPVDEDAPGCGAMLAKLPKKEKEIPLPLKHTDVKGQIIGYIATIEVTQQFHNPYDQKIEAVYVFPLPQNAAINEFIMTIGERRIRGIIRERKEAEEIYREARRQGYVASLLTQERPNIFTQKVANIEPGKNIDINIKYFNTLAYVDGWYEFVFPMVVGPRFNPPGYTDGVGAVARGKAGISGQKTEVQYLKPGERSGHDITVTVEVDAGVVIEEVVCTSHVITKTFATPEKLTVKLSSLDSIPNKDFVLRYKVAGKTVKSALVTHHDKRGGFFTLMLYPPESLSYLKRAPMEMIFVLDCSGSMSGKPIAKAKQAITRALRKLQPNDTFQIIRFSNNASQLGPNPIPATPANIRKGLNYVKSLHGSGGTMMIEGIKAALDFAHDPHRFRLVSFMTDGYIGNEVEILAAVHQRLGASRIFSFGVGSSVNRYLLDRMAKLGKGAVAYIGLDDSAGGVVDLFYERISHPALTDITIDWGNMQVTDVYPHRIRDLFVGRPLILTGRFKGQHSTTIRITGKVGDLTQEIVIGVNLDDSAVTHPGIACVWARKKIETLANQATHDNNSDLPQEIKQVALEYGLMSAYTAFIAVDSSRQTIGDHGITVAVPVPVPDGVRYDTTVQN